MGNETEALHILIVDDERDIREGSQRILSRMGFKVSLASRGDEGLEKLAETQAAIMLLDLKMPGMDGMDVLARVGEIDPEVLVIVITGFAILVAAFFVYGRFLDRRGGDGQDLADLDEAVPIILATHIPLVTAFYQAKSGASEPDPRNRVVVALPWCVAGTR